MRHGKLTDKQRANSERPKMFHFIRELNMIYGDENKDDMPVYKTFEFIDNSQESKGSNENENKLNQNQQEEDDDSSLNWEEILQKAGCPFPTSGSEGSKGRKKIYLKRDVEEEDFDMPEMVAFFEESNFHHLSKDIFIDTESVYKDDPSIEDYELNRYTLSSVFNSDDAESTDSTKETLKRLSCITSELQPVISAEDSKINNEKRLSRRLLMQNEEGFSEIDDVLIDHPETLNLIKNVLYGSKRLVSEDGEDFDSSDSVCSEEMISHTSHTILTTEEEDEEDFDRRDDIWNDNPAEKVLYNILHIKEIPSKDEEEALQNSLTSSPTEAEEEYYTTSAESLKSEEIKSSSSESNTSAFSAQGSEQGECNQGLEIEMSANLKESSSIEVDDPPSGPISILSSSSTGSARSFAFPVISSDWHGSPVRMSGDDKKQRSPALPISDRRKSKRKTHWRILVCCKNIRD